MLMGSTFGWWARPPRKFRIIGTSPTVGPVEQSRWQEGTLILLLKQRRTEVTGSCSRQNRPIFLAPTRPGMRRLSPAGNVTTAVGSGVSVPIIRREGQYFVIKYVN